MEQRQIRSQEDTTFSLYRSTDFDSWRPEQLRMMMFGGNNRAHVFFKQHGWTYAGRIEAQYTSRAANLYRQILAKEVAEASNNDLQSGGKNGGGTQVLSHVAPPNFSGMDSSSLTNNLSSSSFKVQVSRVY